MLRRRILGTIAIVATSLFLASCSGSNEGAGGASASSSSSGGDAGGGGGDEALTWEELMQRVTTAPPPALKGVPADLAAICFHCLEKDPTRRYATASDLAGDLARFLDGAPVYARPLGLVGRFLRRIARHPVITALVTAVLVASVWTLQAELARARAVYAALPKSRPCISGTSPLRSREPEGIRSLCVP